MGGGYANLFFPIEEQYHVWIVYGKRRFEDPISGLIVYPEVLLIEASNCNQAQEGIFKYRLFERFGIQSERYDGIWDYEQYVRIAEPAYDALQALFQQDPDGLCYIVSHEFMGMPLVCKAILTGSPDVRTIFYAHEVASVRPLVEDNLGHDTMFYNVLEAATAQGMYLEDAFGSQGHYFKHALIEKARYCDNIFAVGDYVVKEMRFLGSAYDDVNIDLVYNGIPAFQLKLSEKQRSKRLLQEYANSLLDFTPDYVFTHVTRLVTSKGLWRDMRVLQHLDEMLAAENKTAILFILSTLIGPGRSGDDVWRMEAAYGWPMYHRIGYPDLEGAEIGLNSGVAAFNLNSSAIKVVFVNQFGWSRERCGKAMPEAMEFMDIRKGSDVEFGQSIYEPFGIAQVEPLCCGTICVVSNVCGCVGFVQQAANGEETPNLLIADYTELDGLPADVDAVRNIGQAERDHIEAQNSRYVAEELLKRLPRSPSQAEQLLHQGYEIGAHMSWEVVARNYFLPGLAHAARQT